MAIAQPKADSVREPDRVRVGQIQALINALVAFLVAEQSNNASASTRDRVEQTLALIKTLLASLPDADCARFVRELTAAVRPMSGPRAGEVLGTVVRLLPQRESWTVAELKQSIDKSGIQATSRELYNALSYLKRKKHISRIGYGRYLIDGMPFVTTEDLGGQPSITEGEPDD